MLSRLENLQRPLVVEPGGPDDLPIACRDFCVRNMSDGGAVRGICLNRWHGFHMAFRKSASFVLSRYCDLNEQNKIIRKE